MSAEQKTSHRGFTIITVLERLSKGRARLSAKVIASDDDHKRRLGGKKLLQAKRWFDHYADDLAAPVIAGLKHTIDLELAAAKAAPKTAAKPTAGAVGVKNEKPAKGAKAVKGVKAEKSEGKAVKTVKSVDAAKAPKAEKAAKPAKVVKVAKAGKGEKDNQVAMPTKAVKAPKPVVPAKAVNGAAPVKSPARARKPVTRVAATSRQRATSA
ncbi:hypothetical protein PCA20602_04664 [Pandoraea capi]|uniref:Uncharacterized protein n=1 Tax=Pandoraea capi TaxID=2508286 RepID=A0ABY6WB92_9BURK|nr:hypothetical protein [Pandoraea capi]VVE50412.1 hypothetical protein PCA20602_04664 [Pandoraea capi]